MPRLKSSAGATLVELVTICTILGVLLAMAAPPLQRGLDRIAVVAARDALAAGVARTRAAAIGAGGATLVLDLARGSFEVHSATGDTLVAARTLAQEFGVALSADGAAERVLLTYDGIGIGRLANRTIRIRRGDAEAGLTVSAYGRARAW